LWKARIKSFIIGLAIGAGVGYYANK
jgi:hypothetical protein